MKSTRLHIQVTNPHQAVNPAAALAIFVVIALLVAAVVGRWVSRHPVADPAPVSEIR
jgi:cytochrome b